MLTITEKAWDDVRPKSVKKTGLSKVIKATVKAIPGGRVNYLKDAKACDVASNQLATLLKTLKTVKPIVAKAKDDKKGAVKKIDTWIKETQSSMTDIVKQTAGLDAAIGDTAAKLWAPKFKALEAGVRTIMDGFKKVGSNQGQAEGIMQEAEMELVRRAGELKEKGWHGDSPKDFIKDADFKSALAEWNLQVEKWIKAAKLSEELAKKSFTMYKPIDEMKQALDEVAETGGNSKALQALKAKVDPFYLGTRTDRGGNTYHLFRDIPSSVSSSDFRKQAEAAFEKRFSKVKKIDADSYFQEELAKHGFQEKQMLKARKQVEAWNKQVVQIESAVSKLFGKTDGDIKKDADMLNKLMPKLTELRDKLVKVDEMYKRGRRNQQLADQLAAKVNASYKKKVEDAMDFFEKSAAKAKQVVQDVKKNLLRRSV